MAFQDRFKKLGKDVSVEFLDSDQRALIALQWPTSVTALEDISSLSFKELYFMQTQVSNIAGVDDCRITRCGYTGSWEFLIFSELQEYFICVFFFCWSGEDGVEISVPGEKAAYIVKALLNSTQSNVQLAGLGARDSLRLEAGLCLYGNDIDQTTTPIEAGLAWLVGNVNVKWFLFFNFLC